MDRLHIKIVEAVYRLHEAGQIPESERDRLVELLACIDDYDEDGFEQAWMQVEEAIP